MNHLADQLYLCKVCIGDRFKETVVGVPHHVQCVYGYIGDVVRARFGEQAVIEKTMATSFMVKDQEGPAK